MLATLPVGETGFRMTDEFSEISRQLETWYSRDAGERLFSRLREHSRPFLDVAFGYHSLQLGPLSQRSLLDGSRIHHRIVAGGADATPASLACDCAELPFESDSIDLVVALHALEFCDNPHASLREIQRVLRPRGHLLVIGFNPMSLSGLSRRVRALFGQSPWASGRPVSAFRLSDWLHLVGCQVERFDYLLSVPAAGGDRLGGAAAALEAQLQRRARPLGGLYLAHAVKQVPNIRRPVVRGVRPRALMGLGVGKPAATPTSMPPRPAARDRAA